MISTTLPDKARLSLDAVPDSWRPQLDARLLRDLRLHTIAFVTSRAPSAAVALAVRSNPGASVLVLAPVSQRKRVSALGARWSDIAANSTTLHAWEATYRQSTPGSTPYWRFCHTRWLALAAALRERALPVDAAVAVLDDDVLLFERVDTRMRGVGLQHPLAQAETVVNGAYIIASVDALERLAAFLWALYALPTRALANIAWRFGESKPLAPLNPRARARITPAMVRDGRYPLFTDMDAITALRILSRKRELPEALRVQWTVGYRRRSCSHESKALGVLSGNRSLRWVT